MKIEYLLESFHKSFYDKRFYDLAKDNPQELNKMISKYFRKKGFTFYKDDYPYKNITFNFKDLYEPITPKDKKFIKDLGLDFDIVRKYNIGDITENIKKAIKDTFSPYSSINNIKTDKEYIDYFKELDDKNKNKNKRLYNKLRDIKQAKIDQSLNTRVGNSFFSATSEKYGNDITLPSLKIDGNIIDITILTNSNFFENGHDIKIQVDDKEYHFKINIMDKFDKVMDNILKLIYKGIEKFNNSDIEEEPKKEVKRKSVENDVLKIAKIYLGNWKKFTKTGKTKETTPPIEYYIRMAKNPKKTKSSYKMNEVPKSFRLYYKVKARNVKTPKETKSTNHSFKRVIPQKILDVYPEMPTWVDTMDKYFTSKRKYFDINKIFPKKIITDDHERYSKRIKVFIEKVGNLGYYPDSTGKEYMDRRKNETYIVFKYNEKLKGNKEKMNQIMELDKIKKIINKFSYGPGNFKIEDIPKKMIEYLFETMQ